MSYSQGGPGYPPPQQPAQPPTSYGAPGQSYSQPSLAPQQPAPAPTPSEPGESKLPFFLTVAVAVLGLAAYLSSFAPQVSIPEFEGSGDFSELFNLTSLNPGAGLDITFALLAALVAGIGLLPKQKGRIAIAAILAVVAGLLTINYLVAFGSAAWGRYLVLVFILLQAIVAVVVLLFDSGVITPPVPQPKYDQYGYGAPGGYYGQAPGQHQQRPGGYPPPQQGYGGYPQGPSTGGFPSQQPPSQHSSGQHSQGDGPPTPPTGFPQFGQPPAAPTQTLPTNPTATSGSSTGAPTSQAPSSASQPPAQPPQQSSGPSPS